MKAIVRCGDSKTKFMAPLTFRELVSELATFINIRKR